MTITYHEIVTEPSRYLYAVTLAGMSEHLDFLRRRAAQGFAPVAVTFDDGLDSHRGAADVLQRAGFTGTFFVTAAWVGTRGHLTPGDLREIQSAAHSIQSHGWSHKFLSTCGREDLRRELAQSKDALENWLGREVDALSVPGGAYNAAVLRAAALAGYRRVYTSNPWLTMRQQEGVTVTGRYMARNTTTAEVLQRLLDTEGRVLSAPRCAYVARQMVRATVGASLYHRVWRLVANRRDLS